MTKNLVLLCITSAAFIACDSTSREMTGPASGPGAQAVPGTTRNLIRADGGVAAVSVGSRLSALTAAPTALLVTGTTVCDQGIMEEQTDEDGNPNGQFLPVGGIIGGTYEEIVVPADKICVLLDVVVIHSVTAFARSQLFIGTSQIGEDVRGAGAWSVQVGDNSTIGRDMTVLNGGGGPFASCTLDNVAVAGNVSCIDHNPGSPIIRTEQGPVTIGGDLKFVGNTIPLNHVQLLLNAEITGGADVNKNSGVGFKDVQGNTVGKTLQCKQNDPTFNGGPNVANKIKGQCF
jgi:hypothetical protein